MRLFLLALGETFLTRWSNKGILLDGKCLCTELRCVKEWDLNSQGSVSLHYQLTVFSSSSTYCSMTMKPNLQESLLFCAHLTEPYEDSHSRNMSCRTSLCSCFMSYFLCPVCVSAVASGRQYRAPSSEWL